MLTDDATVVLIDYGKAKELHVGADGTSYYRQRGDVAIPIRWYVLVLVLITMVSIYCISFSLFFLTQDGA